MGYSLIVIFSDQTSRDSMFSFLETNYRDWETVLGLPEETPRYASPPLTEVSYGPPPDTYYIGFDYSPCDAREYIWCVCKWIATIMGITHFYYDGIDEIRLSEIMTSDVRIMDELQRLTMLWIQR